MRRLTDIVGDVSKRFKQCKIDNLMTSNNTIVRNVAVGISAGFLDFKNYTNW